MHPKLRCSHCHAEVTPREMRFSPGTCAQAAQKIPPRYQRRSKPKQESGEGSDDRAFTILDVVGDRWTSLVVAAAFFGLQRYDEIAAAIGIATNILADRLKLLSKVGVLDRIPYQDKPVRYEYHLSAMGRDLYSHTVAIHEWANRWLIQEGEPPLNLEHIPCGEPFVSEVVCSECEEPLKAADVSYEKERRRRASA